MNEPQAEYEPHAEPTRGPWTLGQKEWEIEVKKSDFVIATVHGGVPNAAHEKNAKLIAAAGTAAQEARELGYDPQKAVEGLPQLLEAAEEGSHRKVQAVLAAMRGDADA